MPTVPKAFRTLQLLGFFYIILGIGFLVPLLIPGTAIPDAAINATAMVFGSAAIGFALLAIREHWKSAEAQARAAEAQAKTAQSQAAELSILIKSLRADVKGSIESELEKPIHDLEERLATRFDTVSVPEKRDTVQTSDTKYSWGPLTLMVRPRSEGKPSPRTSPPRSRG